MIMGNQYDTIDSQGQPFDAELRASAIASSEAYRLGPPIPNAQMWRMLSEEDFTDKVVIPLTQTNRLSRALGLSQGEVHDLIKNSWEVVRVVGALRYDIETKQLLFPLITQLQPDGEPIELGILPNSLRSFERPQEYALVWVQIPQGFMDERLKEARELVTGELSQEMRRAALRQFGRAEVARSQFATFIKHDFGFDYAEAGFSKFSELVNCLDWLQEIQYEGVVDPPLRIVSDSEDGDSGYADMTFRGTRLLPDRTRNQGRNTGTNLIIDYRSMGNMLADAFRRGSIDCEYDAQIMASIISRYAPELYSTWLSVKQSNHGYNALGLADFMNNVVAGSQDSRLGRLSSPFQAAAVTATYYYAAQDGAPSSRLLNVVATCALAACQSRPMTIKRLMATAEMGPLLTELSQHLGSPNAIVERLIRVKPNLRGKLLPTEQSHEDGKVSNSSEVSADDRIPGYPAKAMVKVGSSESIRELMVLAKEVQCEPFDRFVASLSSICGYAGSSPDVWRAIFAHDWHSSVVPMGNGQVYWRSANLCDISGCQVFAVLDEIPDARYELVRFCTAGTIQDLTGRMEARPPRPNYRRYDWLQYRIASASKAWDALRDQGASASISKRMEEGRQLTESERVLFATYSSAWEAVRAQIAAFGMEDELGIAVAGASLDELKERVEGMMTGDDVRVRWLELLREVVLGCAECFKRATIFGYPPKFDADLEAIGDAASHYERMVDWLKSATDRYVEMVVLFEDAESYAMCGETLARTESYLEVPSLESVFDALCKQFREARIRATDLQAACRVAAVGAKKTSAVTGKDSKPETQASVSARAETRVPVASKVELTSTLRAEEAVRPDKGDVWIPPLLDGTSPRDAASSPDMGLRGLAEDVALAEDTALADSSAPALSSPRDLVIAGYEESYQLGLQTGLMSEGAFVRVLESVKQEFKATEEDRAQQWVEEVLYGAGPCSVETFLSFINKAFDDHVRPQTVYRVFEGFEEPSSETCTLDSIVEYYLLRAVAERLRIAGGNGSVENLEYWVDLLVEFAGGDVALPGSSTRLVCEIAIRLAVTLDGSCMRLADRLLDLCSGIDDKTRELMASITNMAGGGYLMGSELARVLDSKCANRELKELSEYASNLGSDSYNDQFSGATHLWAWLMGHNCDERYMRVQRMVQAMKNRSAHFESKWVFADEDEVFEFIDKSYGAQTTSRGRPSGTIEGAPRRKLAAYLMNISRRFERYQALMSANSESYVDPVYETLASAFIRLVDQLSSSSIWSDNGTFAQLGRELLDRFPADGLPWDEEGPITLDEDGQRLSPALRALFEMQQHRIDAGLLRRFEMDALPDEDVLWDKTRLASRMYVNNLISASARNCFKGAFARMAGVREYTMKTDWTETGRWCIVRALWEYERVCTGLNQPLRAINNLMRQTAQRQIQDDSRPEDARKAWLRHMLALLRDDQNLEEVLAYRDFIMESSVANPSRPSLDASDVLYGTHLGPGLHDSIREDLILQGGFYPTSRLAGIAKDIRSDEIQPIRSCLQRMRELIDQSPIPINGRRREPSDGTSRFASLAERLFQRLGFTVPLVTPFVEDDTVGSFALEFLAFPNAQAPDGSMVCPLGQLVSMAPVSPRGPGRNACLMLEVYTSFEALLSACEREGRFNGRRIALYLGEDREDASDTRMLTLSDRMRVLSQLALCPEGTGYLLLDEVLLAYLLHFENGSERLGTFYRCSAQFTKLHPYADRGLPANERMESADETSVAPSDTPPLFYGRSEAVERIMGFHEGGVYIVCGARRMGKTSMLREAEAILTAKRAAFVSGVLPTDSSDGHTIAVYCDLRGHTGGSVDSFWVNYVGRYVQSTLPGEVEGIGGAVDASTVIEALSRYMHEGGWRLLLLLDEADDMLRFDSGIVDGRTPQTSILESLNDFAKRDAGFKFVLCGLHMTMRYSNGMPNKVTGYFGEPIVVTPLWEGGGYLEAYNLVWEPMKSMGYRLDHRSVLRIIGRTGYYPNLINQVMEKLLTRVRQRRDLRRPEHGLCIDVPDYLVEDVFEDYDVILRGNFADTIAVDPVYGAVVYAIAYLSYVDADRDWSPVGVADINDAIVTECRVLGLRGGPKYVETYLDELRRIRVLRCEDRTYTIRDPEMRSLLRMKGREGLHDEFDDALKRWSNSSTAAYLPELARDVISWRPDGVPLLSPLNRKQGARVDRLLQIEGTCVILGSDGLGLGRLVALLRRNPSTLLPSCEGWRVEVAESIDEAVFEGNEKADGGYVLWLVTGDWDVDELDLARSHVLPDRRQRFLFVAGPSKLWNLLSGQALDRRIRHLSVSLCSWEEQNALQWLKRIVDYDPAGILDCLQRMTGFMPDLMERLDARILNGGDPAEIQEQLQDTGLFTQDVEDSFDDYPLLGELIAFARSETANEGLSVLEWHEMLGVNCDISRFVHAVQWFLFMGMFGRDDGSSDAMADPSTIVYVRPWIGQTHATGGR